MNDSSNYPSILRLNRLVEKVPLSRSSIYRLMERGLFPRPVKIGITAVGWLTEDIDLWIAERKLLSMAIH